MELINKWLPTFWGFMNEHRVIGALIVVVVFALIAVVVDLILVHVLLTLARRSRFHLDDAII